MKNNTLKQNKKDNILKHSDYNLDIPGENPGLIINSNYKSNYKSNYTISDIYSSYGSHHFNSIYHSIAQSNINQNDSIVQSNINQNDSIVQSNNGSTQYKMTNNEKISDNKFDWKNSPQYKDLKNSPQYKSMLDPEDLHMPHLFKKKFENNRIDSGENQEEFNQQRDFNIANNFSYISSKHKNDIHKSVLMDLYESNQQNTDKVLESDFMTEVSQKELQQQYGKNVDEILATLDNNLSRKKIPHKTQDALDPNSTKNTAIKQDSNLNEKLSLDGILTEENSKLTEKTFHANTHIKDFETNKLVGLDWKTKVFQKGFEQQFEKNRENADNIFAILEDNLSRKKIPHKTQDVLDPNSTKNTAIKQDFNLNKKLSLDSIRTEENSEINEKGFHANTHIKYCDNDILEESVLLDDTIVPHTMDSLE